MQSPGFPIMPRRLASVPSPRFAVSQIKIISRHAMVDEISLSHRQMASVIFQNQFAVDDFIARQFSQIGVMVANVDAVESFAPERFHREGRTDLKIKNRVQPEEPVVGNAGLLIPAALDGSAANHS